MAGSNTYAYPAHANTQEYCCATHVDYVLHKESPVNVYWKRWSPQSSRYRSEDVSCMVSAEIPPQHEEVVRRKV